MRRPDSFTDAELARAIDTAEEMLNAKAALGKLKAEQLRRKEADAARLAEIDVLKVRLGNQRDAYRAAFVDVLDELDITAPVNQGPLVAKGMTLALNWYALGSALAGALGERFRHRWDGHEQLELRAPTATRAYWAANGCRPPKLTREEQPWRADLERLIDLIGPVSTRIGNGG
jgi:hypothetical protein